VLILKYTRPSGQNFKAAGSFLYIISPAGIENSQKKKESYEVHIKM
jgi:hypothetical protein